tara:strand:+ start:13458 stop:14534 length:1077 start_codon:yes stop_codon:yes gene_type:complete
LSKILNIYQKKNKEVSEDFFKFWYDESRFQYRPVVGYTLKKYRSKFFNINHEGFRSKENFKNILEKDKKKIFFFGSSALVGIPNLADDQTVSNVVEKKLNNSFDCLNYGLIASKINSEFALIKQVLTENNPEFLVLYTGYNDLNAAYHGHKFEYYDDIDALLKMGFEYDQNKSSLLYGLDLFIDSFINKFKKIKNLRKKNFSINMKNAQKKRRDFLKSKENKTNYDFIKKVYLDYLELIFYLCKKKKTHIVYIHQSSLLTTDKELSEYENQYYNHHQELGLYKNSDLKLDQEVFKRNHELFKNSAHKICYEMKIDYIDFDKIIVNNHKGKNIFYDNVHLTYEGSKVLSDVICNHIMKS